LDFSKFHSQNAIIDLPCTSSPPNLGSRRALGSFPTSPVTPNAAEYDFEMEDITQDVAGSERSSPSHGSGDGDNRESHPIINGTFLFDFDHTLVLRVCRLTMRQGWKSTS